MTTEEKAKRFDEVVEEFRGLLEGVHEDKCDIMEEDILKIVPELKKSEDEKIRKVLIDYFKGYKEHEECGIRTFYGIPTNDFLAWLEKQGASAWSEEDEEKVEKVVNFLKNPSSKEACPKLIINTIDWLKSLKGRVQPKWKPSEEHIRYLQAVVNDVNNIGSESCSIALRDLLEQLKKL